MIGRPIKGEVYLVESTPPKSMTPLFASVGEAVSGCNRSHFTREKDKDLRTNIVEPQTIRNRLDDPILFHLLENTGTVGHEHTARHWLRLLERKYPICSHTEGKPEEQQHFSLAARRGVSEAEPEPDPDN